MAQAMHVKNKPEEERQGLAGLPYSVANIQVLQRDTGMRRMAGLFSDCQLPVAYD